MRVRTAGFVVAAFLALMPVAASAQLSTPPPEVTAESESWYMSGAPINLGGILYYPSGPITHFIRNEMVFTGFFGRVPVYKRTTQEPGSVLYVPLAGGLVRPYERRRSGDLAGTVGSTAPSFPVDLPAEEPPQQVEAPTFFGEPAPVTPRPVGTTGFVYGTPEPALQPVPTMESSTPTAVGTTGVSAIEPAIAPLGPRSARVQTVQRPVGLNSVFIEYKDTRWYAAGPAEEFSAARFTKVGEYSGFTVYQKEGQADTVYLATTRGQPALVAPYSTR